MAVLFSSYPDAVLGMVNPRLVPFRKGRSTLFRETEYTRKLNHLLCLELMNADLTSKLMHSLRAPTPLEETYKDHQRSAKQLVNLIIQRGSVPDYQSAEITDEISNTAAGIGVQILPTWMLAKTGIGWVERSETMLFKRYKEVIKMAPANDRPLLRGLCHSKNHNLKLLRRNH